MKKIKKLLEEFKYWEALEILENEIEKDHNNPENYFEAAHIYRGVGEMKKAFDYYKKAEELGYNEANKYLETVKTVLGKE